MQAKPLVDEQITLLSCTLNSFTKFCHCEELSDEAIYWITMS